MKVQIYSQWMEDVYIPVRVKQFTKAAKLSGHSSFTSYVADEESYGFISPEGASEREVVAEWLDGRETGVA